VQDCCSDYVVSSYTPTLDALLRARSKEVLLENDKPTSILLVTEPSVPGLPVLTSVKEEARVIGEALPSSQITHIGFRDHHETSSGSVMGDVLDALPTADVCHFACHGQQHPLNPLLSGFKLRDGMLTVAEIMKLNLPRAQFAFLSACETAKGDKTQPDQTVHLAATMLFAGFRSVIGTMWCAVFSGVMFPLISAFAGVWGTLTAPL
jgi:CHAT domain-containing protein